MMGVCAFCGLHSELMVSHVLPAFVFRWLKKRSGQGHIRHTENPNVRIQDGPKFPWLCKECEGKFSKYETSFASNVFHPWHNGETSTPYKEWMLKFCVSVSWRVLKFARGRNPNAHYTDEQQNLMDMAEKRWKAFLEDEVPHPNKFEQHLLFFDFIEDTNIHGLPSNFNRFMTGAVALDIVGSESSLMTFAKLGRFMIFGIIQKGNGRWEGTKIHVKDGIIKPGKFVVPAGLLDLFREKANHSSQSMEQMSSKQMKKIEENILGNLDEFAQSDQFASILADAEMFGVEAILSDKKKETD